MPVFWDAMVLLTAPGTEMFPKQAQFHPKSASKIICDTISFAHYIFLGRGTVMQFCSAAMRFFAQRRIPGIWVQKQIGNTDAQTQTHINAHTRIHTYIYTYACVSLSTGSRVDCFMDWKPGSNHGPQNFKGTSCQTLLLPAIESFGHDQSVKNRLALTVWYDPTPITAASWFWQERFTSGLLYTSLITRFMGPTWGPSGADRTQVGPMLVPWTLLSGMAQAYRCYYYHIQNFTSTGNLLRRTAWTRVEIHYLYFKCTKLLGLLPVKHPMLHGDVST